MGDSISFYNQGFSLIQNLWNTKFIKGYAKTIPSNLVKEHSINEPFGQFLYANFIPNWTKQEKCIKIIENKLKNE